MPVILPQAPPASLRTLDAVLPDLLGGATLATHLPRLHEGLATAMPATRVESPLSMPVYVLGLEAIVAKHDLAAAKPVFWTHVLGKHAGGATALATAQTSADSRHLDALSEGAPEFWPQFQKLDGLEAVRRADFELRELRVPALHVEAFWLRGAGAGGDLVVPFRSHDPAVVVGHEYPLAEFLATLRPGAEAVLGTADGDAKGG